MDLRISDPSYLLRYAYPCIEFWFENKELALKLRRDSKPFYQVISLGLLRQLRRVARGEGKLSPALEKKLWKLVPFALKLLGLTSRKLGKVRGKELLVDREVLRRYFWKDHRELVKALRRKELARLCDVCDARVERVGKSIAWVEIPDWKEMRRVKLDLLRKKPRPGDRVKVHFFHVCEIL
jgi:hypothetical protein